MREPLKKQIDKSLDKFLPKASAEPRPLHRAMRYSVFSEGKRIRPIILLESCAACGGSTAAALPAASAVEMIHTYSLIHDDLPSMDDDDYRRGKPSCHKAFGEAMAILAGDALLTLAFNVILKNYRPDRAALIAGALSEAIGTRGMVGGQALDIVSGRKDREKRHLINRLKTAKLFEASAKIGAIAAGAKAREISAISKYGALLGEAFQMTDDIIDGEAGFSAGNAAAAIKRSKESLKIFGDSAANLKEISDMVSARTR